MNLRSFVLFLALGTAGSPAFAARPITPPAPEFPTGMTWINSEPIILSKPGRRGVTLLAFLDFTSMDSIRVIPVLKTWKERYAAHGMSEIIVHAPDFGFARNPAFVRGALKRFGLDAPAVLDNDRVLWKAYGNEGWPVLFLIDSKGRILYDHLGEGGYYDFELAIRETVRDLAGYRPPDDLRPVPDPPGAECPEATPWVPLGSRKGKQMSLHGEKTRDTLIISSTRDREVAYRGRWVLEPQDLRLDRDNPQRSDFIRLVYHGAEADAVMDSSSNREVRVFVKQNDLWLHGRNAGKDVRWDDEDRSYILVSEPRLYYVTANRDDGMQELYLYPEKAGVGVYAFDFSNACQTHYDHR